MARQWTNQQRNAIYATDGSVLVSAAAGSGKTAVLVERVINLITREENPMDVDRLLIVTFTRAAATEMRQRLSEELNSLIENDPYNPNLLKQKQLLYNASICTIDSFCSNLVREYFHTLQINADFRNAEDSELNILENQALDTSFEDFYKQDGADFVNLVNAFSSKGGDVKLRETVLKICKFLSTQPFPYKWLDDMLKNYDEIPVKETIWGKILIYNAHSTTMHAINITENSIKMLAEDDVLYEKFISRFEEDSAFLQRFQEKLYGCSWDEIKQHIHSFVPGQLRAPKGYTEHPIKLAVAKNRDEVKSAIKEIQTLFSWNENEAKQEIREIRLLTSTLFELIRHYLKILSELKAKKNILSFSDIESLTVKLLAVPSGDSYQKTEQANEISARYDTVMVDEFQDVNDVQDLIFKCVSTDENNIFVVGDVKQSIYGFRQAKPEIFINRKNEYKRFDEENPQYPATIILDKNFRSRVEVCDAVNFIFSRLMSKESAQMDYTSDERLNVGASYEPSEDCCFELAMIEKNAFDEDDNAVIEAQYIANRIRKMMSDGFMVTDGGVQRKATFGDFAVIMRSPKKTAATYVKVLSDYGIPAFSDNKNNSFDAQEIKVMLNLLRVINNPTLDIPLLSIMCSPIYGFTPDELAEMRSDSRYKSLYASVVSYSEKSIKAKMFIKELEKLRNLSYACGIDELLGRVYDETAFLAITSAVGKEFEPVKNLNLLRDYARNFEKNGYKTLSDFIQLIDKMIENDTPLPASSSGEDGLNGVRVLSIHSSKGLEYPVCFIADAAHQFNEDEVRKSDVLVDSHAGLGIKKKDGFCRYNTLPMIAVRKEIEKNNIAEEIRILYVALTRAREKLIVVSTKKDVDKYLENQYSKIVLDKIIEPYTVSNCKSISDWITLCALVHPSLNHIRKGIDPTAGHIFNEENTTDWKFELVKEFYDEKSDEGISEELDSYEISNILNAQRISEKAPQIDDKLYGDILKKNISFEYPNRDIMNLPQKVSASQIAHEQNASYFERIVTKPKFLKGETATAVERGTAHHRFLEYCDFSKAREDINAEINRLVKFNILDEVQANVIDASKLSKLLHTKIFDRIIASSNVKREEQFFVKVSPSLIYDEYKDTHTECDIILQGAVDLVFVEDNKLVIVDYKTDKVSNIQKLKDLYSKQLELYKVAMSQSTELEVKECVICSVWLDDYISL
ncbi:MAG: helicase-exonuclease AddAB subunit AddA [Ruminococcus sp.]|nr:helicase-exonuclease AddAB subunit AddA [Ruminococcus sp.]